MKLPESDRAKLQALVDEGHVTWADINAALDARIKQATNALLTQQSDALNKMPASWQARQDAWTANQSWDLARREGRAAICARYGEKVADVMASDPGATEGTDTDPQATAKLMARQGILDRYRQIMDQELTALDQRLGPQPPRPNTLPVGFNPYEMAQFEARLTKQETMAAVKLAAVGGALSGALKDAIGHLAGEITQNVAKAVDG